jgi:hypothetical protein
VTVDLAPPRMRSYTALSTYMECPRQYRVKYVDKIREDPAIWSIGGTAFHSCAEWILTGELDLDSLTDEGIANGWDDAWREAYLEVIERNPAADPDVSTWRAANGGREHAGWWHKNGPEMVRAFIRWRQTVGRDLVVIDQGVEHRFEVEMGGVPVVAIPDALVIDEHGQVNILDWKSGRRAPSGSLQLAVYRAAVLHGWGLNPVWGHFYLTRKAVLIPYDLTTWTPEYVAGLFTEFDSRERAGDYTPTPGDACKFCIATREHCPYGKEIA